MSDNLETRDPRYAEAASLYARKGLGSRTGFGTRPALLIIDMSNGFTDPETPVGSNLDAEVEAIKPVLQAAREAGALVVYTTTGYTPPDFADGTMFVRKVPALKCLVLGTPLVEIDERLKPSPGEQVILKKASSSFFGTNLGQLLSSQRIDTVIVTGCSTSGCIRHAAHDACMWGFYTIVPRECVGDRSPGPHEANLFDINAKYADVIPQQEVLDYLARVRNGELVEEKEEATV